jgi:hypothetical protein
MLSARQNFPVLDLMLSSLDFRASAREDTLLAMAARWIS